MRGVDDGGGGGGVASTSGAAESSCGVAGGSGVQEAAGGGSEVLSMKRIKFLTEEIERMKTELMKLKESQAVGKQSRMKGTRYTPLDMTQYRVQSYTKYFVVNIEGDLKRKINPFTAYKEIERAIGAKPVDMTSMGRNGLLITVGNHQQGELLKAITKIDGKKCNVQPHKTFNTSRGLLYISEFDISAQELAEGLREQDVIEVTEAPWIKVRRPEVKVFLATFNRDAPPETVKIPGESLRTRVSEYQERPMQCKICQEYGHTSKRCSVPNNPRCGRCSNVGHETKNCSSETVKCYHCSGEHVAWNRKCPTHIFQAEVTKIQQKSKMSRREAVRAALEKYPDGKNSFAKKSQMTERPETNARSLSQAVNNTARTGNRVQRPMSGARAVSGDGNSLRNTTSTQEVSKIDSHSLKNTPATTEEKRKRNGSDEEEEALSDAMSQSDDSDADSIQHTLRKIYDQYSREHKLRTGTKAKPPKKKKESTCKALTQGGEERVTIYVGMMKLSKMATECEERTINELEKYGVARLHFYPPVENEDVDALMIGIKPFPRHIDLTDNASSEVIPLESFSDEQRTHLRNVVQSGDL